MKFTIDRNDASAAVKKCMKVVTNKLTLPILGSIRITATDGRVTFAATDLDRFIECEVAATVAQDGSVCLSAKQLDGVLRGDGEASFSCDKKHKVTVSAGSSEFKLSGLKGDEMPDLDAPDASESLSMPCDDWMQGYRSSAWAAADPKEGRPALEGMRIEAGSDGIRFVATDGKTLALCELEHDGCPEFACMLPTDTVEAITAICAEDGNLSLGTDGSMLIASIGGDRIISKLIEDRFPDYRNSIPKFKDSTTVDLDCKTMLEALSRVSCVNNDQSPHAKLTFKERVLTVSSEGLKGDKFRTVIDVNQEGQDIEITAAANRAANPLRRWGVDSVRLEMGQGASAASFTSENRTCVVWLMRAA